MAIRRVEILDHKAFGKMVAEWSIKPETRPQSLAALKAACAGMLRIPARITNLTFVDVPLDTMVVRVPNKEMVEEAVERFGDDPTSRDYPAPAFYRMVGGATSPPALETLYCRIADYTIGQCQ